LLCHLTTIFEKLIAQRVTKYFKKFQLLSECQYGFRERYSTTTVIADIYDEFCAIVITKCIHTCAAILYLKKVFNCVNHSILLKKYKTME